MDYFTRKFTLQKTRSKLGAITDAVGRTGNWPFRRTISYHIGVNCDAISISDDRLRVLRRGHTVAVAELPRARMSLWRLLRSSWDALLFPRHARKNAGDSSPDMRWEDMLRPRRRK
jgi:hypothetical protein